MKIVHKIKSLLRVSEKAWPGRGLSNREISLYFGQNEALKKETALPLSTTFKIIILPASEVVVPKRLKLHKGRKKIN